MERRTSQYLAVKNDHVSVVKEVIEERKAEVNERRIM